MSGGGNSETRHGVRVPEPEVRDFVARYGQMLRDNHSVEQTSDLSRIAESNYQLAAFVQAFLSRVNRGENESSGRTVLVSLEEARMLEVEGQMRLMRAHAVQSAKNLGLPDTVLTATDQQRLQQQVQTEIDRLTTSSGESGEVQEEEEEKEPEKVDLQRSGGLYTLVANASSGPNVDDLVGYRNETTVMLNLVENIRFVGDGVSSSSENNRPVCMILHGPPGTGKTTSAQAVAKSLDFAYMYVNAENVTSMWAGGTQKNIVKVFRRARIASSRYDRRTLILVDEIDGLVKNRQTSSVPLTGEEYSRITTFLQMLTPPEGVDNSRLVCMFTTNVVEAVDTAFVNRSKQNIFLGYIVRPEDRARLMFDLFKPYVRDARNEHWSVLGLRYPELVPRDLNNLVALVQSTVAERYKQMNGLVGRRQDEVVVPLDDRRYLITPDEINALMSQATPATDVTSYFRNYRPPRGHVLAWLAANQHPEVPARVRDEFRRRADDTAD